jgi:hypothetical protein
MEEQEHPQGDQTQPEERRKEVDLNSLFPGKQVDLNRLFPDEGTRKLLQDLRRNRRDIERFIKNLSLEEE